MQIWKESLVSKTFQYDFYHITLTFFFFLLTETRLSQFPLKFLITSILKLYLGCKWLLEKNKSWQKSATWKKKEPMIPTTQQSTKYAVCRIKQFCVLQQKPRHFPAVQIRSWRQIEGNKTPIQTPLGVEMYASCSTLLSFGQRVR